MPFKLHNFVGSTPTIALVGGGPGDPSLLTVRALALLNNASLVVVDRLISPEILSLISCEVKIANKAVGCADEAQIEIYKWVKEAVDAGRNVVRLKIGDPFLFGRGGEEVLEFRKWGYEPIIVPGISSAYGAPLAALIPLTHRGMSNQVLISTGYGQDSATVDLPRFEPDRTLVLLMAVGRLPSITLQLQALGYPPETPVAVVERASTPRQRVLRACLDSIAAVAEQQQAVAPATIIVGSVVDVLLQSY